MTERAEQAFDSLFFTYEKQEIIQSDETFNNENNPNSQDSQSKTQNKNDLVTIDTSDEKGLISKLQFEEDVRLIFDEKDSLALKSLQDGVVDFSDKRVNLKAADVDSQLKQKLKKGGKDIDLLEVDLGELKSLQSNQVHINELGKEEFERQVQKGKQIIDDSQLDSQKFKLVMIGRKVQVDEEEHLMELSNGQQHMLSSQVFHESGEKFSKGIQKDEGVFKHYSRHVYLVLAMFLGVNFAVSLYQFSHKILGLYEDYLDWLIFQQVKRGRSLLVLSNAMYKNDTYSVESKDI
eukprot:403364684